jgi:Domain of unknown function (DUF1707)
MAGEEIPPVRIGHAERTAAQRALDEHLAAGRLGVEEYADRTAAAANAVVAADIAALFTDLPEPHPELPNPPRPPTAGLLPNGAGMIGLAVIVAIGLVLLTRQPAAFLLIPLAAAFLWFSRR